MNKNLTINSSIGMIKNRVPAITLNTQKLTNSTSLKEKAQKCYMDFSTEEKGYFTRRDSDGNVLDIIRTIFPR